MNSTLRSCLRGLGALLLSSTLASSFAAGSLHWDPSALLNGYGSGDFYRDDSPRMATDGQGNWIAVWQFSDDVDYDIVIARSSDDGRTWSNAAFLNPAASSDGTAYDIYPDVTTDGQGNWLAVWSSLWIPGSGGTALEYDLLCARSSDNGATWSSPALLNSNSAADAAHDAFVEVSTDRNGTWVAAWNQLSFSPFEQNLRSARSTDNGVTWEPVVTVESNTLTTDSMNLLIQPRIAADGAGNWTLIAESDAVLTATTGTDFDLLAWHSTDSAATWGAPAPVNSNATTDNGRDAYCDLATNANGTLMAVWLSSTTSEGSTVVNVASATSADGEEWSSTVPVNTPSTPSVSEPGPMVAALPNGSWVVGWQTGIWGGIDVAASSSDDGGGTWKPASPVNSNAEAATAANLLGGLAADSAGDVLAVWSTSDAPASGPQEPDIVVGRGRYFTAATMLREDDHSTGGLNPDTDGFSGALGFNAPQFAWPEYREETGAYLAHVAHDTSSPTRFRVSGVYSMPSNWLPYSEVGPDNYVRVKYAIYAGGQANPAALNTVPNLRIRAAVRFAQTSILDVYNHVNSDPAGLPYGQEIMPSLDPERPSIYRVDIDPVDVPYLAEHSSEEGILRAFEAYSTDPQDNGYLAMTESSVGIYPALLPQAGSPVKIYAPTASDAGNLASVTASDSIRQVFIKGDELGEFPVADDSLSHTVVIREGSYGVTLDTKAVPANRYGVAAREFFPGADTTAADYVRVEPEKQYLVRFHLTSTQASSVNAHIRCRARTVKWNWVQRFEIGGARAAGVINNAIARESLPGIGCLNPDKDGSENGGWYTLLMHTPLSPDIRPEFDGSLEDRMPLLASEPGPGETGYSFRDLKVALDLLDTVSSNPPASQEQGEVTVDRIAVYSVRLVED